MFLRHVTSSVSDCLIVGAPLYVCLGCVTLCRMGTAWDSVPLCEIVCVCVCVCVCSLFVSRVFRQPWEK
jgi:hypothetical protein